MADELDTFVTALTGKLAEITGVNEAPEHPPERLNNMPMFVAYFVGGAFEYSQGRGAIGLHAVHADLHLGRRKLSHDEKYARPFILRTLAKMAANVKMSSTCEHCILQRYEYGRLDYGRQKTFGVRFVLEVKIKHSGIPVSE